MRKIFPLLLLFTMVYAGYYFSIGEPLFAFNNSVFGKQVIYVYDDTPVYVDIADTDQKRRIGLGGREVMAAREGMLFRFDESKHWSVWMKDMNFGIDILWLDDTGTVVDMREFVYPDTYPDSFTPKSEARYILEVLAGFVAMQGVSVGHKINLNGL